MKSLVFKFLFILNFVPFISAHADLKSDFKEMLTQLHSNYLDRYAGLEYKKRLFGWDIDKEKERILKLGESDSKLSLLKAQNLVNQFVLSARDYHAQAIVSGAPYVFLDIGVHSVGKRVFITYVKPGVSKLINVGDELFAFDGVLTFQLIDLLQDSYYPNRAVTKRDADRQLTARYGVLLDPIPLEPTVNLLLKRPNGSVYLETLAWNGLPSKPVQNEMLVEKNESRVPRDLQGWFESPIGDPYGYTARAGYLPKPEKIIWESDSTDRFYAWIGLTPQGKRVGLIRIPTFTFGKRADFTTAVQAFKVLVEKMQNETDSLILDTLGNRGGSLDYTYALISFFLDRPERSMKFRYRLSKGIIESATKLKNDLAEVKTEEQAEVYFGGKDYFGYPADLSFARYLEIFANGILADAATGAKMGKLRYYNPHWVKPYPGAVHYDKPLFVMIDSWSASCGDSFAAYFQDIGRATVIGTETAGAGAFVGSPVVIKNNLNFSNFRIPIALAYRLNGQPLENRSVVPDIRLEPNESDLFGAGYEHYRSALYSNIDDLLVSH